MAIDPKTIVSNISNIVTKQASEYRSKLANNMHVVDLSFAALKSTDATLDDKKYLLILNAFKTAYSNFSGLPELVDAINSKTVKVGFTDDNTYGQFIAAGNYTIVQASVDKVIASLGIDDMPNSLDYISLKGTNNPTSQKVKEVIKRLSLTSAKPILQKFNSIYNSDSIAVNYSFEKSDIGGILGTATVLVAIKSPAASQQASINEAAIIDKITSYLNSDEFTDSIVNPMGSKGIVAEVEAAILSKLGIKVAKSKSTNLTASKKSTVTGKAKVNQYKLPALRNVASGRFTSLASLEFILRHKLAPQIKLNMGKGDRHDILNYRTGRFARSASIERITRSRDDFITVYYDYMKYPYATFSDGGQQQYPRSRDPKLLITKSIREIASTIVRNRMRAVLV